MSNDTDAGCRGDATVTGTVAGLSSGQTATVSIGAADTSLTSPQSSFTLTGVATTERDVVGVAGVETDGDRTLFTPNRMIIRRAVTPSNNLALAELDFSNQGFDLQTSNFEIVNNAGDELTFVENYLWTPSYTFARLQIAEFPTPIGALRSVPSARRVSGDLHELYVDAYTPSSNAIVGHSTLQYLAAIPAEHSTTLGPQLSTPQVTMVTTVPYFRGRGRLTQQAEYPTVARLIFLREDRLLIMGVTAGYLGGTPPTWDIVTPDFTGVAGFSADWMPTFAGGSSGTIYQMDAFSGDAGFLFGVRPDNGDEIRIAYRVAFISATLGLRSARLPLPAGGLTRRTRGIMK
jgi:hypothetical protein